MNRYNNNDDSKINEREDSDKKGAAELEKTKHQGQPGNAKPQDWNPGKSAGSDENEGGVRPE